MTPLEGALLSLKTASGIAKGLVAASTSVERAELKLKVAEIAEALADARSAVLDVQEENIALRARVAALEGSQADRSRLTKRDGVYYFASSDDAATEEGPFCPRCFEVKQLRMPVTTLSSSFVGMGRYRCPECKAVY